VVWVQGVAFFAWEALVEFIQLSAVAVCFSWVRVWGWSWLRRECWPVRSSSKDFIWNFSLVYIDVKVSFHSPSVSPWILDDPVVSVVVLTPSYDFDCMSSCDLVWSTLVDSVRVAAKVVVHSESSLDWSIGHDLAFDCCDALELVEFSHLQLDVEVSVVDTLWWALFVVDAVVVSGSFKRIRDASIVYNSIWLEVLPRIVQRSSVATTVVFVAKHHVFWGKNNSWEFVVLDASTVSESAGGRESPARTAGELWAHWSNTVTLIAPVEWRREGLISFIVHDLVDCRVLEAAVQTHILACDFSKVFPTEHVILLHTIFTCRVCKHFIVSFILVGQNLTE